MAYFNIIIDIEMYVLFTGTIILFLNFVDHKIIQIECSMNYNGV